MPTYIDARAIHINAEKERHPWLRDAAHFPHRRSLSDIHDLEHHFCRDFACCGQTLGDLHDLLEHYEECHVRLEEEDRMTVDITENAQNMEDVIVSDDINMTRIMTPPKFGLKRLNLEDNESLQPISPRAITGLEENEPDSHKRQRSVPLPPDRPEYLHIDSINLPSSFSACSTPSSLGEDFLARAGLVEASSPLAPFTTEDMNANKPFKCRIPGCDKAYKNPNGLKYHKLHGHHSTGETDTEKRLQRPFQCTVGSCRKRYKNLNGLKYHVEHSHLTILTNQLNTVTPQTPEGSPNSSP